MVINLEVELKKGETSEHLVKRFLKKIKKNELMDEIREKRYYKSPSEKKREAQKEKTWAIEKMKREEEEKLVKKDWRKQSK